jgi:hypothetical protein
VSNVVIVSFRTTLNAFKPTLLNVIENPGFVKVLLGKKTLKLTIVADTSIISVTVTLLTFDEYG